MDVVVELLIVWGGQGRKLLIRMGREVMGMVGTVFHE